jgi:hypothetical protein
MGGDGWRRLREVGGTCAEPNRSRADREPTRIRIHFNPLLAAAFLDFPFCTSRPVARAKLIQIGQLFHSIVVWTQENAWVESQPMSLAGYGLRRFEAKTPEIHYFQTKSHTRRALSRPR